MTFTEAKAISLKYEQAGQMCRIRPVHNKGNLIRVLGEGCIIACLANTHISAEDKKDEWEIDEEDVPRINAVCLAHTK